MSKGESATLALTEALPAERQARLAKILDDYLHAAERGMPVSPEELLAQHADDALYLSQYLSGLKLFHNAADGLQNSPTNSSNSTICQRPGQTIGDYRLLREIGRGGMGVVYEAEQLSLKRRIALKVLPYVAANDEKCLRRFKTESQIAASIEHPNIVPVFAIGEEHGVHFYAMQLIEGKSLREILGEVCGHEELAGSTTTASSTLALNSRQSDAPPDEEIQASSSQLLGNRKLRDHIETLAELGVQAAEALHAAHGYGVVHRDIKPSNLLIDESGKLWITDFGLARCREGSGLTQTGDILGTLRYMSPEQAGSHAALVDHRTDIFSLGVTLYEIAALRHPFDDEVNSIAIKNGLLLKPLRHWDNRIPTDFETIIMKSLAEFPGDRYTTAAELADDLRRFLANEPIRAKKPSFTNRAGKWAKKHRRAALSSVAVLLVAVAGLSIALTAVSREKVKTEVEKAKTEVALDRSQKNLQRTRDVLDRFGSRLAEQLATIPGAERVRLQLLDESLNYYHQLTNQASGDPALAVDVALAYSKIGDLTARTGDKEDALNYHLQAKSTLESLLVQDVANRELTRLLAVCWNNMGTLLIDLGREEEAFEACSEALAMQQRLLDENLRSTELLADAAATYTNLGLVYRSQSSFGDATTAFDKAISMQQQVADTSDSEESLRALALGYGNLASSHEITDTTAAKQFYGRAIKIQKTLVESQPLNLIYQRDLARTYNNLGYLAARGQKWREAELSYGDAIKIQAYLVESAPAVAAYHRDLAVSRNNLGMTFTQLSKFRKAERLFAEAARLQRQLLAKKPHDVQALTSLGGICNNLGMLLKKEGNLTRASQAFQQAVEYQTRTLKLAPTSQRVREMLSNHLFNYADCSHHLGNTEKTLSTALKRRDLWEKDAEKLFGVAKELLSYRLDQGQPVSSGASEGDPFIDSVLETIKRAMDCGLRNERLLEGFLSPLRAYPQFQTMLALPRVQYHVSDTNPEIKNRQN